MDTALEKSQSESEQFAPQLRQVHTITDRFSITNSYLLDDGSMVIVDPASELNVRLILDYIRYFLHRSPSEIDLIVLTHLHPDHTTGIEVLRRECHAPVTASAVAREMVEAEAQGKRLLPAITHRAGHTWPGAFHRLDMLPPSYITQAKLVDSWLNDVEGLPGHPDWRVIASPGHTPESLCLYNPFTCELLSGDTIITSEGNSPLARGDSNRSRLQDTLHTLRALRIHYLYPGHGKPILSKHPLANMQVER
ncbi:MAG TPA: MBL fold metallo-hydrolase [Ktedonobacteraceae bacterium]|nr:MBL fold metallo-hydrolase [Ktedonobacteraceae bacterium]